MRVLWVNEAADFIGGCEQYIFNTVRLLREHEVYSSLLYDCRQNLSVDFAKPFDHAFPMVDLKTQVAEIKPDVIYVHRLSGRKIVEELRRTRVPTVRFFHDYQLFCPREHRYSTLRLRTCRKPMGIRCYPCLGFVNRANGGLGIRLTSLRPLRSAINANKKLDSFVVGSNYMATLVAAHGFAPLRINAIPLYALPPRNMETVSRDHDLFLFVGQLVRSKGVDTLLYAMALMRHPCRLLVAGRGRQEIMFHALAKKLGLNERVSFVGQIAHEELARYYCRATCIVVPSRYPETFGLIGPEAMSYGVAAIGTKVGAIEEWLENDVTGIAVPSNDPKSMARAMDHLVAHPQLAAQMGTAGKQRYKDRFQPDRHVSTLLDLFNTLVGKGRQP